MRSVWAALKRLLQPESDSTYGSVLDEKLAGKLRAQQMMAMTRITPLMMSANLVNAIIILIALHAKPEGPIVYAWAGLIAALAGLGFYEWFRTRNRPPVESVSNRGIKKAVRNATLIGMAWGMLPLFCYQSGDLETKMITIAFVGGMMGGGCFALNVIPKAMTGYLLGIASGSGIGFMLNGTRADWFIMALFTMYILVLIRAGNTMSRTFADSKISAIQVKEQASTISILLKDFEESASDWLWETNECGKISRGSSQFAQASSIDHDKIVHALSFDLDKQIFDWGIAQTGLENVNSLILRRDQFADVEISLKNDNGETSWFALSGKPIHDATGTFVGYRGVATNITSDKHAKERIAYLAHNDALTGLVNRANFSTALDRKFLDRRQNDLPFCLFMVDLDGFKIVNDTKGHLVGDQLLMMVGERLKAHARDVDIVSRIGGDEFAMLMNSVNKAESASNLAQRIVDAISEPYEIEGEVITIGGSIGIALAPNDGTSSEALMNSADLALYRAKSEGKGIFRFFESQMDDLVRERRTLERDLRDAVRNQEFELYFQPLVDAKSRATAGFEALIRWHHPERGLVPPIEFIPAAEEIGLIVEIGDWVMQEACRVAVTWPDDLCVAVNLSPPQFKDGGVVQSVRKALDESGLKPERLEIEITEGLLIENTEQVIEQLEALKKIGVSTSIDDFGTGYSSLSYLLKFPFDKLKIDRSFVSDLEGDTAAKGILQTIAQLGSILELKVTAEGVENVEQMDFLSEVACHQMQGYLFAKPMPQTDISAYLLNAFDAQIQRDAKTKTQARKALGKNTAKKSDAVSKRKVKKAS